MLSSIALVSARPPPLPSLTALSLPSKVRIALANRTQANISIVDNNVIAQLSNNKTMILVSGMNSIPKYARDIWGYDFNFDGYKDLAITTSIDSFTNDQKYTIFTWKNSLKSFAPIGFHQELSNIEVLPASREVRSSYQSGHFWTEDTYKFIAKKPYLFSKSELITTNVWHTIIYNPQGSSIRSLVSTDGRVSNPPHPVLLTVSTSIAPIYSAPIPSSILPIQLSRGDIVTVLDFKRTSGQLNWVSIQSTNHQQKVVKGWVLLSNFLHS